MYNYNDLDDLKEEGIKDLRDIGETATLAMSAFTGYRIRVTDDGEGVFVQYLNGSGVDEIELYEIEYFSKENKEVRDILNINEDEVDDVYVPGFKMCDELYLIDEFIRDDFCM